MIEIKLPKVLKVNKYSPDEPEVIRRRNFMIAVNNDKRFEPVFKNFSRFIRRSCLTSESRGMFPQMKKINKDWIWWSIDKRRWKK
jgi:hypothetical protein